MKKYLYWIFVFCALISLPFIFTSVYKKLDDVRLASSGTRVSRVFMSEDYGDVSSANTKEIKTYKDLEFDSTYYPYYGMLNKRYHDLYKQIYFEVSSLNSVIKPNVSISRYDLPQVVEAVIYDHPELFYLSNRYSFKYNASDMVYEITIKFNSLVSDYESNKLKFDSEINNIINMANEYGTDYEKEKFVHDYLYDTVSYDSNSSYNQSAFSALVNKSSVCAGYSKAFQLIMTRLGIPTYYVTGDSYGDHAWNIIRIDGVYYNVDVTWDDTGYGSYTYFNISDEDISINHTRRGMAIYLPDATTSMFRDDSILYRVAF